MKTPFAAVAVALVAAFCPSQVQAANGFTSTCATWSAAGTILQATCLSIAGSSITSTLDLNTCFTNTQGMLAFELNGNFAASCSNISHNAGNDAHGDTAYLSALCANASGKKFDTAIATSTYIGNSNGVLVC
ncbi:Cyanovirin-N [Mycena latifolia]|nr:Cyanovirin-N [Mycena latifolia]